MNTQYQIQELKIENQLKPLHFYYGQSGYSRKIVYDQDQAYAFAFNRDNSLLAVGCEKGIIIYEFTNGKIQQELSRIKECWGIHCLYFMKNSNFLVSGSNGSITIWGWENDKNKWIRQSFFGLERTASCILMNKQEDQIIAGSWDKTLRIWRKESGSWFGSQIINTTGLVRNLSLNEAEDKLIICVHDSTSSVYILFKKYDQSWSIMQKLDFAGFIQRLCFTIENQFVIQNRITDCLDIYDFDSNTKEFKKVSAVKMQSIHACYEFFPSQFIKSLKTLVFKHGQFVNIFKVNENYNYELIQEIQYPNRQFYGRMTDDGTYLIIGGQLFGDVQIRKLYWEK